MKIINRFAITGLFILLISFLIISCRKEKDILPGKNEAPAIGSGQDTDDNDEAEGFGRSLAAKPRFDMIAFCGTSNFNLPSNPNYFSWPMFNTVNWSATNGVGHFLAMYNDGYRNNVNAQGNRIACWLDDFNDGFPTTSAIQRADQLEAIIHQKTTNTGNLTETTWIILNEISVSRWTNNPNNYHQWVINVLARLETTYHHKVIICSPFSNIAANGPSWVALSQHAYIAIEQYLGGNEIRDHDGGYGLNTPAGKVAAKNWCQQKYQISKNSYLSKNVPANKIFLIEHFGQSKAHQFLPDGTLVTWGRCGVSVADWKAAIQVRGQASGAVGFAGFISYDWHRNAMGASQADLVGFLNAYKATDPY